MTEQPGLRDEPSCLASLVKVGCALSIIAVIGLALAYWQITASLSGHVPQAVATPMAWSTFDLTLTPDRPAAHGTLTLVIHGQASRIGALALTAGVPHPAAGPARTANTDAILRTPTVRLTARNGATTRSCLASCELELPPSCVSSCTMTVEVTVELGTGDAEPGPVSVRVAGGAAAGVGGELPGVEFHLDGASPAASGGG
ncbi:MAG: hypothetical protein U0838_09380 [Chloroflexota bacterium]